MMMVDLNTFYCVLYFLLFKKKNVCRVEMVYFSSLSYNLSYITHLIVHTFLFVHLVIILILIFLPSSPPFVLQDTVRGRDRSSPGCHSRTGVKVASQTSDHNSS